jgi:hypothetical protein
MMRRTKENQVVIIRRRNLASSGTTWTVGVKRVYSTEFSEKETVANKLGRTARKGASIPRPCENLAL